MDGETNRPIAVRPITTKIPVTARIPEAPDLRGRAIPAAHGRTGHQTLEARDIAVVEAAVAAVLLREVQAAQAPVLDPQGAAIN